MGKGCSIFVKWRRPRNMEHADILGKKLKAEKNRKVDATALS
jgi:hypothetical protein